MTTLTTLGNLLPLIVFLLSAGLTVFARAKRWTIPDSALEAEEPPPPALTEERLPFLTRYRWEIVLAAAVAAILLFVILFAPPRLGGEIPPDPNQPGRPFYSLRWGRAFLRDNFDTLAGWSNLLASLACLAPLIAAIRRRSRLRAEAALLLSSLTLAMLAQWTLSNSEIANFIGAALYLVALLGFAYWAWLARLRLSHDLAPSATRHSWELPLLLLLLCITIFGRFYALGSVPYGIEGDEAKWTSEAVNLGILGEPDINGEYHRDALPVSFYLQIPFHRLFGVSLLSARATVAFLSVLASLVFYWLLRKLAPIPLAALAAYLLAVSIFDISASRLANVESFVKLWAVLPLALLAWALQTRAEGARSLQTSEQRRDTWPPFALTGLALALAALTYDTLWPIIGVCLTLAIIELWKLPAQEKARALAALLAPVLLTLPIIVPYFTSRVNYYELGKKGWESGWTATLWAHFASVLNTWFVEQRPDFLYNRVGPLLNASLLPWLAAGAVAALLLVRARSARWLLVWVALVVFPVPIVANSPLGRVYYPALPAVYGLIALALYLFWKEVQRILAPSLKPFLVALALVPLLWLPFFNYFIYFNEVAEPEDRQMRREIGEIAAAVTDDATLLALAVVPDADEPLNNEHQMIELFLLQNLAGEQAKRAYQRVALDKVMPSIFDEFADWKNLVIVLDKKSPGAKEDRLALTEGLGDCFPGGTLLEGRRFDRFLLDEAARRSAVCTPAALSLRVEDPPRLRWELSAGRVSSLTLLCERKKTDYFWLEAEQIPLGPGWQIQINFAPGWSGTGFVMDNYSSQFLGYEFASTFKGREIFVWARTYKRAADHSPAYISVNGVTSPFIRTEGDLLNQWIWERIGPFPNGEVIRSTIARPYNENLQQFMALFMDVFIFTDDPAFSPESELTESMPPQRFTAANSSSGALTTNLPSGQYACRAQVESSQNLVDSFGRRPITSNEVDLTIP